MNIGIHTFEAFKALAASFHGYPAPGLLIGGYMVEKARAALPPGTLFEAVVETGKCLPDAVQLLTPCSIGNNRLKVINIGRYALSLFDKHTGQGFRASLSDEGVARWPQIHGWFMKRIPKAAQDEDRLLREIEEAGDRICDLAPMRIHERLLGHAHMGEVAICPVCNESYPLRDGAVCRGCQGEAPYTLLARGEHPRSPVCTAVPVEAAVGSAALHDMTEIVPGASKGAALHAGDVVTEADVERLKSMGRFSVAIAAEDPEGNYVHENEAAVAFAGRIAGGSVVKSDPPREGKVDFTAGRDGLFVVDRKRLTGFNMLGDVLCATRQDGSLVEAGDRLGATRIIPLHIPRSRFAEALSFLERPLMAVLPLRRARVGILVTGTEVFTGRVQDGFIPLITAKVQALRCEVVKAVIVPDDADRLREAVEAMREAGVDLLVTTGGLSVDPGDVTRTALRSCGLADVVHGAPVLPGCMSLAGRFPAPGETATEAAPADAFDAAAMPASGEMQVVGVPAGALYHRTTLFDALLARLLAGLKISKETLAMMGEGGLCLQCRVCTFPKCGFLK
jgi:formylmethanofuran dehydrogenase subunit E